MQRASAPRGGTGSAASSNPPTPSAPGRRYERALALAPALADAHLNLGCLEHEAGQLASAEAHYRAALAARSRTTPPARFDLAVALEIKGAPTKRARPISRVWPVIPRAAEAHYNLARLAERSGDRATALRHLLAYRRLTAG
jgi:tetratricopeptide (TPR) repeat protein